MPSEDLAKFNDNLDQARLDVTIVAGRLENIRDKMNNVWRNYYQLEQEVLACPVKVGVLNG